MQRRRQRRLSQLEPPGMREGRNLGKVIERFGSFFNRKRGAYECVGGFVRLPFRDASVLVEGRLAITTRAFEELLLVMDGDMDDDAFEDGDQSLVAVFRRFLCDGYEMRHALAYPAPLKSTSPPWRGLGEIHKLRRS